MALKALILRKNIDEKKMRLKELRERTKEFETRESELMQSIDEAVTDEEKEIVTSEVEKFDEEKTKHEEEISNLSNEIEKLEGELAEEERKKPEMKERKEAERRVTKMNINIRNLPINQRVFDALPIEERKAIVEREDVRTFFSELRSAAKQQRAITGGDLTIPVVFLELIAENMFRYSKLLNRVRVRTLEGEARQTIAGTVPEAVWTEMCGEINELTFNFNQVTLDGYKVAGFVPICNSLLEDNDVNLAAWIVEMISEAIGLAKDKAILYGKGAASKMPLGIVTRLAQQSKPSDYPANAPEWVDLHKTNILQITSSLTGAEFWAELTVALGNTFTRYSRGEQFWAMNSKTYSLLKSKVITFTATGDIAANVYGTLPIITGNIDILEFIPDGDIIGGYGDLYLWSERAGMQIDLSREVMFIQDNTVFRGKERADGAPIIPGAFVAVNINGNDVTTAMTFAADKANDAKLSALNVGSEAFSPAFDSDVLTYAITASGTSAKIEATAEQAAAMVEINYNGENVRNGGTVTWIADGATYALTVTVKNGNSIRVYTINVTKAGA